MQMRRFMSTASAVIIAIGASGAMSIVPAHAATTYPATCTDLQTILNGTSSSAIDTVTLHDPVTPLCPGAFTLPAHAVILQGLTQADGFDGASTNQSLTGNNIGATTIQNLTFAHGSTTSVGGALNIDGASSPTITNNVFTDNHADNQGGALKVQVQGDLTLTGNVFGGVGHPNTTNGDGGALVVFADHVAATGNKFLYNSNTATPGYDVGGGPVLGAGAKEAGALVFSGNTVIGNQTAGANGAGATLRSSGGVTMSNNTFRGNVIAASAGDTLAGRGGGVGITVFGIDPVLNGVIQSGNTFDSNVIHTQTFQPTDGQSTWDFGGAGELVRAPLVTSVNDTFINNHVDAGAGGNTAIGGGIALQGDSGNRTTLNASNMVVANNSVGAGGEGGGIYAGFTTGCGSPPCIAAIQLFDSTVVNNTSGGSGAQMGGDNTDTASVTNSIVIGPIAQQTDVEGFGTTRVTYSDTCVRGTPYTGTGNVCVDPKLANVAGNNVHETTTSPTVDRGSNALVPATLTKDYEGDARIIGAAVDMGADEFNPPAPPALPKAGHTTPAANVPAGVWLAGFGGLALLVLVAGGARLRLFRRRA